MSPAIRLGASRILAVGIRSSRAAATLAYDEAGRSASGKSETSVLACPPLAQICGVFFNAIFLDHLDADVEHLRRMNTVLAHQSAASEDVPDATQEAATVEGMRRLDALVISPSEDLALIAQRFAHRMPRLVRYMLDGLGIPDAQSADLTSYLLFDSAFTRTLVDIGYHDAGARIDEIEEFVRTAPPLAAPVARQPRRLRAIGAGLEGL